MMIEEKSCIKCEHKNTCEIHKESVEFHKFLLDNPEFNLEDLLFVDNGTEEDWFSPDQINEIHMELIGGFGKLLSNAFGSRCFKFEGG